MIAAQGLAKTFGRRVPVTAVHEATLSVDEGSSLGILGVRGAGKTTLLRMLAAALRPTAGRATIGGFDTVTETPKARNLLGFLPEFLDFRFWSTGHEFLTFWTRLVGLPARRLGDRVDELLQFLEVQDVLSERPLGYSIGVQKRLGLLQALLTEPRVLILDEPMAALVSDEWGRMTRLLQELRKRGITMVVSSPHLRDVQTVCDRVTIMNEGKLTRTYDTQDLLRRVGERRHARIFVKATNIPPTVLADLKKLDGVVDTKVAESATIIYALPGKATAANVEEVLVHAGVSIQSVREAEVTLGDVLRAIQEEG